MCFGSWGGGGGVCLNEKNAIPQPVFYKSAAGRRENPTVVLRVGYSSNNVITLCYSKMNGEEKTGHNRILIEQLTGLSRLSLQQLFHCRQYEDS